MKDILPDDLPNVVIVYDWQWKIDVINASAISLLGYSKADELIGKPIKHILHKSEHLTLHGFCRDVESEKRGSVTQKMSHIGKDGKRVSIFSQFGIIRGRNQDREDYRYIQSGFYTGEDTLDGEDTRRFHCLKILAENVPGLMMLLIDNKHIVQCSVGTERLIRVIDGDKNTMLKERLPGDIMQVIQPLIGIAQEGTSVSREFKHGNAYYSVRLIPIPDSEDGDLYVIILQNITETKIVENKLNSSKKEAEAANEEKSAFIAQMSHEIRTPLNAIIGFTDQLIKTKLTKKQSDYLNVVNNSSRHLLSTLDDILVISRIESGQTQVDKELFTIGKVIKAVNDILELSFREKSLNFHIHCDSSLKELLLGDAAKIRQVLINLVSNAIKFTHKGGVLLRCSLVQRTSEHLIIRFDISDTGIGIESGELKQIFDPFHQVDESVDRGYLGSGLGLSISKDHVKSMGGELTVKSSPDRGSTFSFTLKLKKGKTQWPDYEDHKPLLPNTLPDQLKILFADDDPMSLMLGKVILNQYNASSVFAGSGREAIHWFMPGRFHVVLLDMNMPGISGVDVAKHIRMVESRHKHLPTTRIIALTANVLKKYIDEYLRAGIDDFLLKPFREIDLIKKILAHCPDNETVHHPSKQPDKPPGEDKHHDLDELLRITKGDKAYTLLMLDTFLENGKLMLDQMQNSYSRGDYGSIAEAAHRLLPSVEQLKFNKATTLLKGVEASYLKKSTFRKDPKMIEHTLDEVKVCIREISKARDSFT